MPRGQEQEVQLRSQQNGRDYGPKEGRLASWLRLARGCEAARWRAVGVAVVIVLERF